jgi:hypothetical protein
MGSQALSGRRIVWDSFCDAHAVSRSSVPLFATDETGNVESFAYGRNSRLMLRRSPAMRAKIIDTVRSVLAAPASQSEGVLYMMHRLAADGCVTPLYIGKAGRHGRSGAARSANLKNIERDQGKFARWGYNYAYHFGDLSAAALPGHTAGKVMPKYKKWAQALFERAPTSSPRLRFDVRFWCTAWGPDATGIWREFSPCPLAFAEYLLIGVAAYLFPGDLLNEEGVNRAASTS